MATVGGVEVVAGPASSSIGCVAAVGDVDGSDVGDHVPVATRTITMPAPSRMGSAMRARMRPVPARGWVAAYGGGDMATPA